MLIKAANFHIKFLQLQPLEDWPQVWTENLESEKEWRREREVERKIKREREREVREGREGSVPGKKFGEQRKRQVCVCVFRGHTHTHLFSTEGQV